VADLSEVSLALGLFRVNVPGDWILEDDFPFHTIFRLPDGGTMTMRALVYEDPEIERTGDYASYLLDILDESEHDALHKMLEQWIEVPGLPVLTISARAQADDGAFYRNVWRSLQAKPPLYRTVTWEYEPRSTADGRSLVRYTDALHESFQHIEFAEGPADLDLVAATPELKVASFGNVVILRMPIEWKRSRENDDGTGRHCIDEPGDLDRWTLWVDWDQYINADRPGRPVKLDTLASALTEVTGEFVTDLGDKVITQEIPGDKASPLRSSSWHRYGRRGGHVVGAHFSLVMVEDAADHPEMVAVRELVGREALRALLIPRPPKG
jgi:hypothetical protein